MSCSLVESTSVLEEPASSIFRIEERAIQENEGTDLWCGLLIYPEDGDSSLLQDTATFLLE